MADPEDEPDLYLGILRYSGFRFAQIAEEVSNEIIKLDASGVFEDDGPHHTVWDEYRHYLEVGPIESLDYAFESLVRPFVVEAVTNLSHEEACLLSLSATDAEETWCQNDDFLISEISEALVRFAFDWDEPRELAMELAWKNAPPSVGMDFLVNEVGEQTILQQFGNFIGDLFDPSTKLDDFASILADEILCFSASCDVAPFDGTFKRLLKDGQSEEDWLISEDLLPFLINWRKNVLEARR